MRTKAIASARVKTDAVDARALAHLLRADLLPEAYIAPRDRARIVTPRRMRLDVACNGTPGVPWRRGEQCRARAQRGSRGRLQTR
jgi:hypothetical protein